MKIRYHKDDMMPNDGDEVYIYLSPDITETKGSIRRAIFTPPKGDEAEGYMGSFRLVADHPEDIGFNVWSQNESELNFWAKVTNSNT